MHGVRIAVVSVALTSCTTSDTDPAPVPPALPACSDPLALPLADGSCVRPGIPPDGCAPGFVHDGEYGCEPILPEAPCPAGLMAVPGESACRAVKACGQGRWGDIAVDASTEYVDGAYTGGQNDGSEAHPWTTISEAVMAAAPGALI